MRSCQSFEFYVREISDWGRMDNLYSMVGSLFNLMQPDCPNSLVTGDDISDLV